MACELFSPIPTEPPELEGNPGTLAKVALGRKLFFEHRLSQSDSIAWSTCHDLGHSGGVILGCSMCVALGG
jgi:cytochrome c peroxidase